MALKKCPSCKNIVSTDSYCCPRCGRGFFAMKVRRVVIWLIILGLAAWAAHHYLMR